MFLDLKSKFLAAGAALVAFLLGFVKILMTRNKSLKNKNKQLKSDLDFREDVDILDEQIEQKFSHRAEEAKQALDNDEIPKHLRNPRKS